jgi:hypothetical protein
MRDIELGEVTALCGATNSGRLGICRFLTSTASGCCILAFPFLRTVLVAFSHMLEKLGKAFKLIVTKTLIYSFRCGWDRLSFSAAPPPWLIRNVQDEVEHT